MNWLRKLFGWHVHEWGKWERSEVLGRRPWQTEWTAFHIQERTCKSCGFTEREVIRA